MPLGMSIPDVCLVILPAETVEKWNKTPTLLYLHKCDSLLEKHNYLVMFMFTSLDLKC